MKRYWFTLAFCFCILFIQAQNLVPNGDFEQHNGCPITPGGGPLTFEGTYWYAPAMGSSDYFNRCVPAGEKCCGIPCSILGYNQPRSGDGMTGFYADFSAGHKEYLETRLLQPLVAGKCYYFEMYVKVSSQAPQATDHIGVYFSIPEIKEPLNWFALNYSPQICSPNGVYFSDNNAWQKVKGIYTATGGEEYIVIGSFDPIVSLIPKVRDKRDCTFESGYIGSYVMIDDVLLTENIPAVAETHSIEIKCTEIRRLNVEQNQPNISYKWNDGSTLPYLDITTAGKYWVETHWNNCAVTVDTFFINPRIPFGISPDITLCSLAPYTLEVTSPAGFNYLWSTGSTSKSIVVNGPGVYWVRARNDTCTLYDEIKVDMVQPIKPDLGNDIRICEGQVRQLDASQPGEAGRIYNYKWFMNNLQLPAITPTLDVIQSGSYRVVRSVATCETSDTIEVQTIPAPSHPMLPDSFICDANSIRVSAGNTGFDVSWSTAESTGEINIGTPGTYWVMIGNDTPCIVSDTFTITQHASPSGFLIPDTSFCEGDTIFLNGNPGFISYQWSTGQTTDMIAIDEQGSYSLKVSDGFCSNMETITVRQRPAPSKVLLEDSVLCERENQQFVIPLSGIYQYTLGNAQSISDSLVITGKGQYQLQITDSLGCSVIQTLNIFNYCEPSVFVPNAFSPNADGVNDLFTPVASFPDRISAFSFSIYNRWGQLIYMGNSYGKAWDGTSGSLPVQADVYVYVINVTWSGFGKDTRRQLKGNVTLLR
jgi:gliding motility-associated-like protein